MPGQQFLILFSWAGWGAASLGWPLHIHTYITGCNVTIMHNTTVARWPKIRQNNSKWAAKIICLPRNFGGCTASTFAKSGRKGAVAVSFLRNLKKFILLGQRNFVPLYNISLPIPNIPVKHKYKNTEFFRIGQNFFRDLARKLR